MKDTETLKQIVKDKYAGIAVAPKEESCGCCGDKETDYSMMNLVPDKERAFSEIKRVSSLDRYLTLWIFLVMAGDFCRPFRWQWLFSGSVRVKLLQQ